MCGMYNRSAGRVRRGGGDPGGFTTVGEIFPGRVCPVPTCPTPKHLIVRYKNGRPFVVCSNQVRDDPNSCQFTANKFGKDRAVGKGPSTIACITCDVPVEFVLSIGRPNGDTNPTSGKTE
ncbi:unnamed protein product [Ectocarpus sp. CCAP 1310/34]|nr:unnamed protein product [Ectocarpus sp. CCAP 1310/34]